MNNSFMFTRNIFIFMFYYRERRGEFVGRCVGSGGGTAALGDGENLRNFVFGLLKVAQTDGDMSF